MSQMSVQEFEGAEGGLWLLLVRIAGCALYDAINELGYTAGQYWGCKAWFGRPWYCPEPEIIRL